MSKTLDVLIPALRQFAHNTKEGELFAGFDYEETQRVVAELQQQNAGLKAIARDNANHSMSLMIGLDNVTKQLAIGNIDEAKKECDKLSSYKIAELIAERDAGVIEKMIDDFLGCNKNSWMTVGEMLDYANQLRNQSKGDKDGN